MKKKKMICTVLFMLFCCFLATGCKTKEPEDKTSDDGIQKTDDGS